MLQINIHWDKRQPGLGIIKSEVDSMLANAKKNFPIPDIYWDCFNPKEWNILAVGLTLEISES